MHCVLSFIVQQIKIKKIMAKFQKLVNFLVSYNDLCVFAEVTWEIIDDRLYIDGNPNTLGNLISLLWSHTDTECYFFTCRRNNSSMIEVLSLEREEV